MDKKFKNIEESETISTYLVLPNDTNFHNHLFGGVLLSWIDITASITARRHCNNEAVTASINNVSFNRPILLGETVTLIASISRVFNTSMEIFIEVWVEDIFKNEKIKCNEAITTFVAISKDSIPISIPQVLPKNEVQVQRYDGALRRKQLSLILAGKMKPNEAVELKKIFTDN